MQTALRTLFFVACAAVLPLISHAQTAKPATRPTAKPVAKPAPKSTARPATKPAPKPAARPIAKPAPVAPAPEPVPAIAPASARPDATSPAGGSAFEVGTNAVNLGIGLGNRYAFGAGLFGGSSSVTPAFSLSYERGIIPLGPGVLGVGIFAGYQSASYNIGTSDKWKYTDIVVALRGAFHYPVADKFDAYGGLSLSVRHSSSSFSGSNSYLGGLNASSNDFAPNLFVGGRYFFLPSLGGFAELGYDQTYLKLGLTGKF